jgi:DNA-binding response OmpR family regulator
MRKILLIEDDIDIQAVVRLLQNCDDIEFLAASTCDDAAGIMSRESPHVVLLDLNLRRSTLTTSEFTTIARTLRPEIKIFLVCTSDKVQVAAAALNVGYLKKPFTASQLKAIIYQDARNANVRNLTA